MSYAVRGSVHLVEGGWSWAEHLLDDAEGDKRWLSVEEDPDLELVLWTAEPAATSPPAPRPSTSPAAATPGRSPARPATPPPAAPASTRSGTMRYHDYRRPGGARLSFEAYGEAGWEVARGEQLHRADVMIYPQAGPEAS